MPLRSVEAASRDDAIAAAREQFGPQARIVGVRRVRSGGVLGFFATERYVAEVAESAAETAVRPAVPSRDRDDAVPPADFASPLASASPARARAAAPPRNGAAAWAAEAAARSTDEIPEAARLAAAAARAARTGVTTSRPSAAAARPADEDRVSELVGLLSAARPEPAPRPEPAAPASARPTYPRASFPRTGSVARPGEDLIDEDEPVAPVRGGGQSVLPAGPAAPSPFTAALARMVAGDQDVRQAVQEALAPPAEKRPRDDAEPWPARAEHVPAAETAVPSPPARQEEEPVGIQVIAPPSTIDRELELPTWAAEPEVAPASVSPREEAIADLLRGALAQGHSDEALAGILRKVLAGASPQSALSEPDLPAPAGPVFAVPTLPVPPPEAPTPEAPAPATATFELPVTHAPELHAPVSVPVPAAPVGAVLPTTPVTELPAVDRTPVEAPLPQPEPPVEAMSEAPVPVVGFSVAPSAEPAAVPAPAPFSSASDSMWGTPASSTLWGDPLPSARAVEVAAPIPATVAQQEPASLFSTPADDIADAVEAPVVLAPVVEAPVVEAPVVEAPVVEAPVVEAPVVELEAAEVLVSEEPAGIPLVDETAPEPPVLDSSAAADSVVEPDVAELLEEADVAEVAPLLARTASDPAPMMSLDATTVMPPLSLLPPLPGSRGRGRPPVPPASSRPGSSSSVPAPAEPDAAQAAAPAEDTADDPTKATADVASAVAEPRTPGFAPTVRSLATVTRLPVAPLMAGPEMPELLDDPAEVDADELLFAPIDHEIPEVAEVAPSGSVADRLQRLGLPAELLGSTFDDDVAERGTYAALTRSLALQLPKAPALPSGSGQALFVVGPGVDALRAARSLAAALHLDPDCVQWATRGDLAGLAPRSSRVTSVDSAIDRRQECAAAGTVTIVAVDAPLRSDAYWMAQMMSVWTPAAVWAVVEATRKPEDLGPWLDGLPQVDALVVQDTDLSADPAAVLGRVHTPVALLDGARATPHRWASLLCERLESTAT